MEWQVEFTNEFERWWDNLPMEVQVAIDKDVEALRLFGPSLGRPRVDTIQGSRHSNMKELRTQCHGEPYRTLFAFDPRRCAILLIGGCKSGDRQFYEKIIPEADRLYDDHLRELRGEGLI